MRTVGAMEIASRIGPDCRLIFTGGLPGSPEAYYMMQTVKTLDPSRIMFADTLARRTAEHPKTAAKFITHKRFILVTSAVHIPRSVKAFRDAGFDPIPFAVDYQYNRGYELKDYFPTVTALIHSQEAIYEYFAYAVYSLGG
jgi:uncharacterized SAM-binding protein YcdF (DUF218 family)